MMTPQQQRQIDVWVQQRDAILHDIGVAKEEFSSLLKQNETLGESNKEIESRILVLSGRIEELQKKEEELKSLTSKDVADLTARKSVLETEVLAKEKEVSNLELRKSSLLETIEGLTKVHDKVFDRAASLNEVVEHVVRVSEGNLGGIKEYFDTLKKSMDEIIALNDEHVKNSKAITEKMPLFLAQISRPVVRRIIDRREVIDSKQP